uniref:HECT domain-containing protein n=1 Tax=Macrostomum lignano TaxID=282301 RepID=A0A1I8GHV2_9PLAT
LQRLSYRGVLLPEPVLLDLPVHVPARLGALHVELDVRAGVHRAGLVSGAVPDRVYTLHRPVLADVSKSAGVSCESAAHLWLLFDGFCDGFLLEYEIFNALQHGALRHPEGIRHDSRRAGIRHVLCIGRLWQIPDCCTMLVRCLRYHYADCADELV